MDIWDMLYEEASKQLAPCDVSDFLYAHHVGCALEAEDETIFTGFCIEGTCGTMNLCAERVAALRMYMESKQTRVKRIVSLHINALEGTCSMPCGICREFFMQLSPANKDMEILCTYPQKKTLRLEELIPNWWGWERVQESDLEKP